jgi:hypothetical protein
MLYTILNLKLSLLLAAQNNDLLCLDLTDFEHFNTEYAQDRLQQLPN